MTTCSSGWSMPKKMHVCTRLYLLTEEGCGEPCLITCWTSHGVCRGRVGRQFDGCARFGSQSAYLTSAGLRFLKNYRNWCRNSRVGLAWRLLRSARRVHRKSDQQSTRSRNAREPRGPGGVTCLCLDNDREPPRLQPTEVPTNWSSSTDRAGKIDTNSRSSHIPKENLLTKKRRCHAVSCPVHQFLLRHSGSYLRFDTQNSNTKFLRVRSLLQIFKNSTGVSCLFIQSINKHESYVQHFQ